MPTVTEVPPLLQHIDEVRDMHALLSCGALTQNTYLELTIPHPSTFVQAALKSYLAKMESETTYLSDYIEFPEYDLIHIIDLATLPIEFFIES